MRVRSISRYVLSDISKTIVEDNLKAVSLSECYSMFPTGKANDKVPEADETRQEYPLVAGLHFTRRSLAR